jgi:hypothetical protein
MEEYKIDTSKMMSWDRVLELTPVEGKATLSSTGLIDKRLFTGENKLHAIKDSQTCLWSLKYEEGSVPQVLRCQFTSFRMLLKYVENYFEKRNIVVKEVR